MSGDPFKDWPWHLEDHKTDVRQRAVALVPEMVELLRWLAHSRQHDEVLVTAAQDLLDAMVPVHKKTAATGDSAGDGQADGTVGNDGPPRGVPGDATTVAPEDPARGGETASDQGGKQGVDRGR